MSKRKRNKKDSKRLIRERKNSLPSRGEWSIIEVLEENNIKYIREYYFHDLVSCKGHKLFYDFYLPEYKVLIEYDGIYHYDKTQKNYTKGRHNDGKKDRYAERNGYKLLRIPYWEKVEDNIFDFFDKHFPINSGI